MDLCDGHGLAIWHLVHAQASTKLRIGQRKGNHDGCLEIEIVAQKMGPKSDESHVKALQTLCIQLSKLSPAELKFARRRASDMHTSLVFLDRSLALWAGLGICQYPEYCIRKLYQHLIMA